MYSNKNFESVNETIQVIGFGQRFLAYFVDGVILWTFSCGIGLVLGGFVAAITASSNKDAVDSANLVLNLFSNCVGLLFNALYFTIFWGTTGQTPGKMALGIKVVNTDGSPITFPMAFLRYIGYIISSIPLCLGFIWISFDNKRQGWHDKIAGTYVVSKDTHFSGDVSVEPNDANSNVALIVGILVIGFVLMPICIIAILLLLGPVIGNVFSNVTSGLQP